jgi:putative intracellular protease/amidase
MTDWSIGILIFDGAEEMDFAGPWEVLTAAAECRG